MVRREAFEVFCAQCQKVWGQVVVHIDNRGHGHNWPDPNIPKQCDCIPTGGPLQRRFV